MIQTSENDLIVSFPWYPFEEIRPYHQLFWEELRKVLTGKGMENLPERISEPDDFRAHWSSPHLLLTQCCGYHIATNVHDLRVVAVPDFFIDSEIVPETEGASPMDFSIAPGQYRSAIIKHREDKRKRLSAFRGASAAYNEDQSYSGHTALFHSIPQAELCVDYFGIECVTDSHFESLKAVGRSRGEYVASDNTKTAEIAAVDAITLSLIRRSSPHLCADLEVIAFSEPAQAPPYVTSRHRSEYEVQILRDALVEISYREDVRDLLSKMNIKAIIDATNEDYLPLARRINSVEAQILRGRDHAGH